MRPVSLGSILLLSSHRRLDHLSYLFPSGLLSKILYVCLIFPEVGTGSAYLIRRLFAYHYHKR